MTLTLGTNNGTGGNFAGAISGSGGIVLKTGSGTQTLSGTNTFTGGIRSTGGTLNLNGVQNNAVALLTTSGSPTININGTQTVGLFWLSDQALGESTNSMSTVNVNSGGVLNLNGSSALLGANSPGGAGILNVKNSGIVNATTTDFRLGNANTTVTGILTLEAGGTVNFNTAGTVIRVANGAAAAATATGIINLNGGAMTVNGQIRGDAPISATAGTNTVNFNGGTLKAGVSITTFLQGMDFANVRNGGAKFDTNGFNITVAQTMQHSAIGGDAAIDGGLTKLGAGTLTLTGNSTYTGETIVRAGTLALSHASNNNLANSHTIQVDSGATLNVTGLTGATDLILASNQKLQGTGTIVGNATVGGASFLAPGNSPGVFTFDNNLTLQSGATVEFETGDLIAVNGLLTMPSNWVLDLTSGTNWG